MGDILCCRVRICRPELFSHLKLLGWIFNLKTKNRFLPVWYEDIWQISCIMHISALILTTFGVSSVLASGGALYPHRRAAIKSQVHRAVKPAPQKRASSTDSKFLTSKTESKSPQKYQKYIHFFGCDFADILLPRICRQRDRLTGCEFRYWRVVRWASTNNHQQRHERNSE